MRSRRAGRRRDRRRAWGAVPVAVAAAALVLFGCEQTTPADTAPAFPAGAEIRDRTYVAGTAIRDLALPEAAGGDGALTYSLGPEIPPGLAFDAAARVLSGTPTGTGDYEMVYAAVDEDDNTEPGDSARLTFAIAVREGSSLVYRGRGDQVFVLTPDGESLDDALHAVELGGASAEVYLISTNTTGDTTSPRIAPVGVPARTLRGAEAARASGWRPPSPPAPDRPWVTEFNANPPLGRPGPPAERRQGLLRGRQARDTVAEGDTFTFLDVVEVPATARAVVTDGAKTAAVWVADRDWGTCEECVSQEMADAIADRFLGPGAGNDIHDWITAYLARTYGERSCSAPSCAANWPASPRSKGRCARSATASASGTC